jgi:hypothetical protein
VADRRGHQRFSPLLLLSQTLFELVAQLHQLIDFGDNAFLFSKRRQGNQCVL